MIPSNACAEQSMNKWDLLLTDARIATMSRGLPDFGTIEGGAIANLDEDRMVGHYWLRAPDLAPAGMERRSRRRHRAAGGELDAK